MARKSEESNEVLISYSTGNPSGSAFVVDNNEDAYIGYRIYINKKTKVAPALFDIIWDILNLKDTRTAVLCCENCSHANFPP